MRYLYKRHATHFIDTQICFHVETHQPRPCRTLMIGIISLNLRTYIIRIVSATLGAQCTQALRSQQFFRHNIKHLFLLGPIQRRIVKGNGKYHVGTYAPVHHITIHIVEQIAILIAEDVYERLSGDFCLSVQCIGKNFIAPSRTISATKRRALYHSAFTSTM